MTALRLTRTTIDPAGAADVLAHASLLHGPQERRRRGRALASRHGGRGP